ncbi:hypothetical protein AMS68_006083 [Peltaster fructicola]|uniref:HCP-like protein n=1 Tax=Peltaster fructicola TaxID=286661 RepID=A0A6H0Y0W1_9PEZI|nr:hypothetical protein AMS68_006083 [Peltaster fructicola]
MAAQPPRMGSNYVPGLYDDYYSPPTSVPELISPEPQRHMPEMSTQIQHGLQNMTLDHRESILSNATVDRRSGEPEIPSFSPFPKLKNPPANVPPSDEEFEETLWNARNLVLDSTDPEMQLAWAADALICVGVSADNEERTAAAKPSAARSSTPHIEHALKVDAMNIVTFLSSQHHPKAEFLRGMWLEWGRYGQREDKKEAFRCYSRAADKGYARAEYRIGMLYESFNDATKALRHYHRGVQAGDSASCYRLGMMTLRGQHGQQQDWQHAIELIRQSAETADENAAQGAYVYGMLLARQLPQIDVPETFLQPDEAKARMYIEKAAFLKFAKAQLKMGSSYELGAMGCDFDPALSIHYYALASKQGEAEADMALSKWFLVERAAATGLATAEFALGYFYEIGMCVPVDTKKSMEWYEKAAQHGNEDAKGRIDALSRRQYLSKKDHEQVAITRIKSMHNSMRGARPERRPVAGARLGQIPEAGAQGPPPRAASIAPYPTDDRPMPQYGQRSSSTVPYPAHDGPPSVYAAQPGGREWASPQPPRPATTTYGEPRPSSQTQPGPGYGGPLPPPPQPQYDRRYGPGPGPAQSPRPGAIPPQGRQGPGQRIVSGPPQMQQGPGGYPSQPSQRLGQYPSSAPGTPQLNPQPQQQQRPSVGYAAPYDDRRSRPGPQGPPQAGSMQQGRPAQAPMPQSQSVPNMSQGRPQGGPSPMPQNNAAPRPPAKDPTAQAAPQPKPPKGPTTFEEMGVHAKKNGEDCVMM